jgi:hypothetical protein
MLRDDNAPIMNLEIGDIGLSAFGQRDLIFHETI